MSILVNSAVNKVTVTSSRSINIVSQSPSVVVSPLGIQGAPGASGGASGGIFEHVLPDETFVIQERTQALIIGKLRNEGIITINGRLILRN